MSNVFQATFPDPNNAVTLRLGQIVQPLHVFRPVGLISYVSLFFYIKLHIPKCAKTHPQQCRILIFPVWLPWIQLQGQLKGPEEREKRKQGKVEREGRDRRKDQRGGKEWGSPTHYFRLKIVIRQMLHVWGLQLFLNLHRLAIHNRPRLLCMFVFLLSCVVHFLSLWRIKIIIKSCTTNTLS